MKQKTWKEMSRDAYILEGRCKECGRHIPVNKHRLCEFCDKVSPLSPTQSQGRKA